MQYAIVYKNRVIAGPMNWNQRFFTNVLQVRHRVQANIPGVAPTELPYEAAPDVRIHSVVEVRAEHDPMTQCLHGPQWELESEPIVARYEALDHEIVVARNHFRARAAEERRRKENSGTRVTIQGQEVSVDTSREGRSIYLQALTLMSDDAIMNWKFPEGWLALTKSDLTQVVSAGAAHIQAAFDWEKMKNDEIDAAENGQQLHAIEIAPPAPERLREEKSPLVDADETQIDTTG